MIETWFARIVNVVGRKKTMNQIKYQSGYKYQLYETYSVQTNINPIYTEILHGFVRLNVDGMLYINAGYAWDGPSGPTLDDNTNMRGSLVHDALYQLMREGLLSEEYREQADYELYRICLEDGMNIARASCYYKAVRCFGSSFAAVAPDPVITAP